MNTMRILAAAALSSALLGGCLKEDTENRRLSDYVNPFIGASTNTDAAGAYHGLGKTFPGAETPFGMVQVSPNTVTGGDNASGYSYEHKTIEGFAFTQMSGTGWFGDLGNFLVTPTAGELYKIAGKEDGSVPGYRSRYDKDSETAKAGYYSVTLTDHNIKAECSATPHCGILRFTFPENKASRIQIDLARRVGGASTSQYVRVVNDSTIQGWMRCTPDGGGWGNGEGHADYTVFFHATFSRPFQDYGFWSADLPDGISRKNNDVLKEDYLAFVQKAPVISGEQEINGKHLGFFAEFPTKENEAIVMKAGISFVDLEGAENNYNNEMLGSSFEEVKENAASMWDDELGKIKIKGGTEDEKTIFYTALYHSCIDPRIYADTDGRYVGGDLQIHQLDGSFTKRTVFSGWDVFRSLFPLQSIINPSLVDDELNSLISLADESGKGYYSRWEFLNSYSGCMIGNPALSVLTDAYMKGIRGYDIKKAYAYAVNTENKFNNEPLGFSPGDLSVSLTLEYSYFDWCLSRLADSLHLEKDKDLYLERSKEYRNIFDGDKGWFRPRKQDGSWAEWPQTGRLEEWYGCIECNPYQQGWFVPHDLEGMFQLMGGKEKVIADLDSLFEHTPEKMTWNLYYNHANEPVHFVPYIYNRAGAPWKTQKWTRFICDKAYHNKVEGLVGNDDAGQMSAWYVLSASGIHPSCPGDNIMEITSPVFDRIEFSLDKAYCKGEKFTVIARNNSRENRFIQKARLNGKPWNKSSIDFQEIKNGGTLELFMGSEPCESWGKD